MAQNIQQQNVKKILSISHPEAPIEIYRLTNSLGFVVELSTIGAGITSFIVPAKGCDEGIDVVLGYKGFKDYIGDGPCMGKTPGRFANRIAEGRLIIDGKLHQLAINNGPNHLHGGPTNFANHVWRAEIVEDGVKFTYISPDGDENYPGTLTAEVTYSLCKYSGSLRIDYRATTDAKTVVNLTNHTYWNLAGESSGSALNHELQMNASRWLPTDSTLVPTGEMAPVEGTPMDFLTAKSVGRDINEDFSALKIGKGYDNCWVVDQKPDIDGLSCVCRLSEPKSGRRLTIRSNHPGVQLYSGNWLSGSPLSKSATSYHDYDGIAIECQELPDSPNKENFPSTLLSVGEEYRRTIVFSIDNINE